MKALIVFALLFSMSQAFATQQEKDAAAIDALVTAADTLSKVDLSCSRTSDCQVITTGARACGGPSGFIYASKKNGNLAEIKYLAEKSTEKEQAFNQQYGIFSICTMVSIKPAVCENKICQ